MENINQKKFLFKENNEIGDKLDGDSFKTEVKITVYYIFF